MQSTTDRPWLRRDTYFADTGEGLHLANATSGFEVRGASAYQVFKAVYPFLDGSVTLEQLRAATGDSWPVVAKMLEPLAEHGFLRWIPSADVEILTQQQREGHSEQIAFLAQFVDYPHQAFRRFNQARVLVVGDTPLANAVVVNLVDNGAKHVSAAGPDILLPKVARVDPESIDYGDYNVVVIDQKSLPALANDDLTDHHNLLILHVHGNELRALPLPWAVPEPAGARTWMDAVNAIASDAPRQETLTHREAIEYLQNPGVDAGKRVETEPIQRMLGALVAYEVFKGITGAIRPDTAWGILSLDSLTGETRVYPVPLPPSWHGQRVPIQPDLPDHEETLEASKADQYDDIWAPLVDPVTLPARRFVDLDLEQVPVRVSAVETSVGLLRTASLWTTADARIDAVARAYEEHLDRVYPRSEGAQIGVGTDLEQAALRATKKLACDVALETARGDAGGAGRVCEMTSDSRAAQFILETIPGAHYLDLGRYDRLHVGLVYDLGLDSDEVVRWSVAAAGDLQTALIRAATDVLGARQIGINYGDGDPGRFIGERPPPPGTIQIFQRSEVLIKSLGLVVVESIWSPDSA